MKFSVPPHVEELSKLFGAHGFKAYLAGGAVRDLLLEREPLDFDIATDAKPDEVMKILEEAGVNAKDTNAAYGTILAVFGSEDVYEITTFRTEGPYSDGRRPDSVSFRGAEEDAKRRDFTVNGMFYDLLSDEVRDLVGGQDDLNKKVVRFIGNAEERIKEDHLRLLRYVRMIHVLGFSGDKESEMAVKASASLISSVSGERIRDEIMKAFSAPKPQEFIELLDTYGLLEILLPEVKALQGVAQGKKYHSEGDAYVHTLLALSHLSDDASHTLVWAALLHDVGKKATQKIDGEKVSFYGHEDVSCDLAKVIFERLKLPNKEREAILYAISFHMHMHHIIKLREGERIEIVRHRHFPLLLEVYKADMQASVPDDPKIREHDYEKLAFIQKLFEDEHDREYPPLITGDDLISLGMKPSKKFSEVLQEITYLQYEKKLSTKEEALAKVKEIS